MPWTANVMAMPRITDRTLLRKLETDSFMIQEFIIPFFGGQAQSYEKYPYLHGKS